MNTERTQFFDQYAPVDDDISALADAIREEKPLDLQPTRAIELATDEPEEIEPKIDRPHKIKKFLGRTAVVLVTATGALVFGHLLVNAVDNQITYNQQVNDKYVNQYHVDHGVNPDTVGQIPAPSK